MEKSKKGKPGPVVRRLIPGQLAKDLANRVTKQLKAATPKKKGK